jgi:hypothetical protein
MGAIWAYTLPTYLLKWQVPYMLRPGWDTRSRRSGGFDSVKAIGIHHDASSAGGSAEVAYRWSCINCPSKPVGNGSLSRDGSFQLWAAGAANTMGRGGPLQTSRGVIKLDDGNATMFAIEAGNDGVGEPWTTAQIAVYPRLVAAICDWATHETPGGAAVTPHDVFAHWEYCAPSCYGRKIDPAGPSPWMPVKQIGPTPSSWNMSKFRADVAVLMAPKPKPPIPQPEEDDMVIYAFTDIANTWSQQGVHLSPEAYSTMVAQGATVVISAPHKQHLQSLLHISGLTVTDLTPR